MTEQCKGYKIGNPLDGYDYDCEYPYSGEIDCRDCIFGSCEGTIDPRIKPCNEGSPMLEDAD